MVFVPKLVQNHYMIKIWPNFTLKVQKIADFFLKTFIFSKFSPPEAANFVPHSWFSKQGFVPEGPPCPPLIYMRMCCCCSYTDISLALRSKMADFAEKV